MCVNKSTQLEVIRAAAAHILVASRPQLCATTT